MGNPETLLERTDRMLSVLVSPSPQAEVTIKGSAVSLWSAGLMAAPLFAVGDVPAPSAEREAQSLVERHLESHREEQPVAIAQLLEFQHSLQLRSKVISAIENLMQD